MLEQESTSDSGEIRFDPTPFVKSLPRPHTRLNPEAFVTLDRSLKERDIQACFSLLDQEVTPAVCSELRDEDAVRLVLRIAQAFDLGYRGGSQYESYVQRLESVDRPSLPATTFFEFGMCEAYGHLAAEDAEGCIVGLDAVLRASSGVLAGPMIFLANFWKGRAHRKRGEYEAASVHFIAARQSAMDADAPKLVAVTQIHESWLAFQRADLTEAFRLLDLAEKELKDTGHELSLGNIESARGRFVRRSGDYSGALVHFEAAIKIYSRKFSAHPNLARALVNAAYVKRLMALDLRPRQAGASLPGVVHARSRVIRNEALQLLDRARNIYSNHHHQGGTGAVLVNAAHLHLESGDIASASNEAAEAFDLGREKQDYILMARARITQATSELARVEEQLGEDPEIARHAHLAVDYADQAIALALETQNKRLLAEAYIARGFVAASDFFTEWEVARDFANKAGKLLSAGDRDHLYKSLNDLTRILTRVSSLDERLRLWSIGQLGSKSLTEVQEEFSELVIQSAWQSNDKNITTVAKLLRTSPKRIRRALRRGDQGNHLF